MQRDLPKKGTLQSTCVHEARVLEAMVTLVITVKIPIKVSARILRRTQAFCPKSEQKWLAAEMHSAT